MRFPEKPGPTNGNCGNSTEAHPTSAEGPYRIPFHAPFDRCHELHCARTLLGNIVPAMLDHPAPLADDPLRGKEQYQ